MLRKYARLYMPDPLPGGSTQAPAPAAAPAPAPTPSPSPAPSPAPAPAAAAPEPSADPFADAAIDAAFAAGGTPKPEEGTPAPKPGAPPAPKPGAPAPKPAAPATPNPKQLREELDRVKSELATATSNRAELEKQIVEARKAGESTRALTAQLETEKGERLKLLAELRGLKREKSPEFVEKYDKPFNRMAERAKSAMEKATVTDEATGDQRQATWTDFVKLYSLDEVSAAREARRVYGDDIAPIAMRYYAELKGLDSVRGEAAAAERTEYEKRTTEEQANQATHQQQVNDLWETTNRELSEKVDDYHDPADDAEAAGVRKAMLAKFDTQPKTLKEKIIKDAHIRQLVGFSRVAKLHLARKDAKIAELQAALDKATPTVPGKVRHPGGAGGAAPEKSFEEGLREAVTG